MEIKWTCRFCDHPLKTSFIDLGTSPLSNAFLKKEDLTKEEKFYPLHVYVCHECLLVQLPQYENPESIFNDYAYFSSYSESWLTHCENYTQMMAQRFNMNKNWQVIEIASNDGYLLQYFQAEKIPVLGIEPAENVAEVAKQKGIPTEVVFFGKSVAAQLAERYKKADLLIANNVLAHVPNLNDFVAGLKVILSPAGIITIEFPHLLNLIQENQFDTIYHEHFSYFSLLTVNKIFSHHQLCIFDVEQVPVHGGSLRIFVKHKENLKEPISPRVQALMQEEIKFGLDKLSGYADYAVRVHKIKEDLLTFLKEQKAAGKSVVGYGAPAKGNTILNYCGITAQFLDFTVDKNPYKQGRYLPGTHIPIFSPDKILEHKPDYLLLLPWNLKDEIMEQMRFIEKWNGRFVLPIPQLTVM